MFYRFTPFASAAAQQPIFKVETRHLAWASDAGTLIQKSQARVALYVTIFVLIWLVGAMLTSLTNTRFFISNITSYTFLAAVILTYAGLFASLYLDFVCIASSLSEINGDVISGRWDLLRMANMREGYFTVSKHNIAQIKAWRALITVIAVRLVAVILYAITGVISFFDGGIGNSVYNAIWTVILLIGFIALAVIFLIEPLWRMRTMTAVGLLVSAHTRNPSSSPLAAIGVTFAVWIAQIFMIIALLLGLGGLLFPVILFGGIALCAPFFLIAVIIGGVYGFYTIVQNWCLRRIALRLATMES